MVTKIKLFLVISCFLVPGILPAQGVKIEKSTEIELLDGKTYYIHHVEKGHTLYSIAKAYEVPMDDILFENPGAKNGLAIGQVLKIPVQSREKDILKSIKEKDFDFFYHVAQSGERYADVARIYLVSEIDLKEANPELEEPFKEGEYVKVPVFRKDPGSVISDISEEQPEDEKKKDETAESDDYFRHVVKKGETLYRISKMYGIGVQQLLAENPGLSPNIKEGQLIRIPGKSKTKSADHQDNDNYYQHEVESDENLYRIALRFKISIDTLRKLNPGIDDRPRTGQIVKIPIDTGKKSYINHTVEEKKEKLKKIAKKYGLDLSELKRMNPTMRGRVYRGQIVRIPVSYEREPFADIIDKEEKQDSLSEVETDTLPQPLDRPKLIKETYEVALMLPFYLELLDSLHFETENRVADISFTPFRFIQFYEGFLLAVDSLKNDGLSMNLHVYDVGQDVSKTIKVLQEPALKEMDLIIGPLYSNSFNLTANFAQLFEIPIVNPLTFRQEVVEDNAHVFKIQPSYEKQVDQVVQFILQNHPGAKIMLVRDNKYQNSQLVADFRKKLQDSISEIIAVPNYVLYNVLIEKSESREEESPPLTSIQIEDHLVLRDAYKNTIDDTTYFDNYIMEINYMEESIAGIRKHASVIRDNVIITITEDRVFMLDFLTKLNVLRDTFNLVTIGLPNWEKYMDFAPALFQNLNVHLFLPSHIDYDEIVVEEFVRKFRNNYNTEPNALAFLGHDIAFFFMSALKEYGLRFPDYIPYFKPHLLQTKYYFSQDSPFDGYENLYWNIIKYEDYSLKELSNPWSNQQSLKK